MASRSVVAVIKTRPDTVLADTAKVMEMAGLKSALDPTKTTILKDNISWHYPMPSANTTPWQLEGVIQGLQANGFKDISCVQNKTVVTNAFKGEDLNKYVPVFKKYNIPVLYNFKEGDMNWVVYKPKFKTLVLHEIFPEGILIPDYFFDKNIVHLPTMKCHIYTTTTGAMKNAFGGLLNTRRHYTHSWIHETLVDLLAIQQEIHSGLFAVMDGTTAGNGPGPRTLIPVIKDYMLASSDQVAIDAVAAKMMGFDPMSLKYIRLADEYGLGNGRMENIEIVGADISHENWKFEVGNNAASRVGKTLWFGPLRHIQKLFFHTPMVHMFVAGSEVYHDYIRWPRKDFHTFKHWEKTTTWGKMFAEYPEK
jgi:uncharacterized protein (DUF362 family)